MPTPTKGARLGGSPAHERLILANLATSLFEHGRITTTVPKAKELRAWIEPMVTRAKTDSIHNRRLAFADLRDNGLVAKLYTEIAPKYVGRPGGYTRAFKLGPRQGDAAPMALLEFV